MNRELLEQPFPPESIKTRPGSHGRDLKYVEAHEYVQRLNDVFGGAGSFDVVQHELTQSEVIVLGKLTADGVKAAATDSLKKAASFLGVGLYLYEGGKPGNGIVPKNGDGGAPRNGNGNGRLTRRQLDAIRAIGKDKGFDREAIKKMALARFGKNVEFVSKAEASSLIRELTAAQ